MKHNQIIVKAQSAAGFVCSTVLLLNSLGVNANADGRTLIKEGSSQVQALSRRIGQVVIGSTLTGNAVLVGDNCHVVVPFHSLILEADAQSGELKVRKRFLTSGFENGEIFQVRMDYDESKGVHKLVTEGRLVRRGAWRPTRPGEVRNNENESNDWALLRLQNCVDATVTPFEVTLDDGDHEKDLLNVGEQPVGVSSSSVKQLFQTCRNLGRMQPSVSDFFQSDCSSQPGWSGAAVTLAANPNKLFGIVKGETTEGTISVVSSKRFYGAVTEAVMQDPRNQQLHQLAGQSNNLNGAVAGNRNGSSSATR